MLATHNAPGLTSAFGCNSRCSTAYRCSHTMAHSQPSQPDFLVDQDIGMDDNLELNHFHVPPRDAHLVASQDASLRPANVSEDSMLLRAWFGVLHVLC